MASTQARCTNCGAWLCVVCFTSHVCGPVTGDVLTCSQSGSRLRRRETAGLTQANLDATCTGPDRPCFPGCYRSDPTRWAWIRDVKST